MIVLAIYLYVVGLLPTVVMMTDVEQKPKYKLLMVLFWPVTIPVAIIMVVTGFHDDIKRG